MKANLGKTGEREQNSEDRQARSAKGDGVSLKGDFEQMRAGWGESENKPTRFECGNTDRLKAQCPIWLEKLRDVPVLARKQKLRAETERK